jgi:hypothetical protein
MERLLIPTDDPNKMALPAEGLIPETPYGANPKCPRSTVILSETG